MSQVLLPQPLCCGQLSPAPAGKARGAAPAPGACTGCAPCLAWRMLPYSLLASVGFCGNGPVRP